MSGVAAGAVARLGGSVGAEAVPEKTAEPAIALKWKAARRIA
jgi:hypothetical protein